VSRQRSKKEERWQLSREMGAVRKKIGGQERVSREMGN
jgi:hypothetical protein